jgi:hypothetical protein
MEFGAQFGFGQEVIGFALRDFDVADKALPARLDRQLAGHEGREFGLHIRIFFGHYLRHKRTDVLIVQPSIGIPAEMAARQGASYHEGSAELPIYDILRVLFVSERRAHQKHALIRQAHDHGFNFFQLQAELGTQSQRGIHTRMAIAARRIRLHGCLHQFPRRAQIL